MDLETSYVDEGCLATEQVPATIAGLSWTRLATEVLAVGPYSMLKGPGLAQSGECAPF